MSASKQKSAGFNPLMIVFGFVVLAAAIYFLSSSLGGPSIASLKDTALNGATPEEQVAAAQELAQMGEPAREVLREVAGSSGNPGVVSVCILGISRERDYKGIDIVLAQLDHQNSSVRSNAVVALEKMLGRRFDFPVNGSAAERAAMRDQIVEDWNNYNGSPLFKKNIERFGIKDSD